MNFVPGDKLHVSREEWTSEDEAKWTNLIRESILTKVFKLLEQTANEILLACANGMDLTVPAGVTSAMKRQALAQGLKMAIGLMEELATEEEPPKDG